MTSADLRALSTIAAEQQECGVDATNCLAELAGALDVQRVIHGSISRIDEDLLVQLRSFDARNAASSERVSWRARSIGGVLDAAPTHVAVLLGAEPPPPAPAGLSPLWGGVALGAGALAAGGTAIAGALYNGTLTAPEASRAQKDEALGVGRVVVAAGALVGIALGVTGGVLLAVADWE